MKIWKIILIAVISMLPVISYSASGDKPNQMVMTYSNVSSSTKPVCIRGEIKYNNNYVFLCISSAKWRRIGTGSAF